MVRAELKAMAKEQIKGKIGILFVMLLITFAITLVCAFIPMIGSIILYLFTSVFSLSYGIVYLKVTNKENIAVSDIFSGFKQIGKALWLGILVTFFTFLWSLLFVIPGIIKAYSYSMAFYILADNPELTAREALNKSKEMMYGHRMDYFVLNLSFIGWYLLMGITFGIAAIYAVPYIATTNANFYNSIKE